MRIVRYLETMLREWAVIQAEGYTDISEENPMVFRYMMDKGRQFESAPLSRRETSWTTLFGWREHQTQQCYRNAQVTAMTTVIPWDMDIYYVEGYVLPGADFPLPIEHAWLSLNGKVIDTTLRHPGGRGRRIFGAIPEGWEYFGVEIDIERCQHILDHRVHISLVNDYECGFPLLRDS